MDNCKPAIYNLTSDENITQAPAAPEEDVVEIVEESNIDLIKRIHEQQKEMDKILDRLFDDGKENRVAINRLHDDLLDNREYIKLTFRKCIMFTVG